MPTPITPFWQCLPVLFKFPLQPKNLKLLLGYTLGAYVAGAIHPLFGMAVMFFVGIHFLSYCVNTVELTAHGLLHSARYNRTNLPDRHKAIAQVIIVVPTVSLALTLLIPRGSQNFIVADVLTGLLMPALVMAVVLSESISDTLNVAKIATLIRRIGRPYLLLWLISALTLRVSGNLFWAITDSGLHHELTIPLLTFVAMYGLLTIAHMTGYVLYENHQKLGLMLITPPSADALQAASAAKFDAQIQQFLDDDTPELAAGLLHDALRDQPRSLPLHARYYRVLVLTQAPALLRHALDYVPLLRAQTPLPRADLLAVLKDCWAMDATWLPRPEDCVALARLFAASQPEHTQRLLLDFAEKNPDSPHIAEAWLLFAQWQIDHTHDDAGAHELLQKLVQRYPRHPAAAKAQALLHLIERMTLSKNQ